MTRPPRLVLPGARLGIVSPASPVRGDALDQGIAALTDMGFVVEVAPHARDRWGYLAGLDEHRASDLSAMFARPDIDGIVCARGGYGAVRMLDAVDWACVRANPKVFVGYSDITTLHLALERRAGLRAFHGPMVTTLGQGLSPSALATFVACLTSDKPIVYRVEAPARARCLVPGRAEGPIAGGCLSLLCAALGTPDQPDFTGRLVLLEDTDEPLYRADRLLAQLTASGLLDAAAGFIVGTLSNLGRDHEEPAFDLDDLWSRYLAPLGKPTILDVPFGHVDDPWTLPLGCMAEMDAEECVLATTEASVE